MSPQQPAARSPNDIFVIGTASLDLLHLAGRTVHAAGGAGMYTALAAWRAGVGAGLFAPKPDPMPELLQPIAERLEWVGPRISAQDLPRLEIEHHGGGRATLVAASWGVENRLTPDRMPLEVAKAAIVHIAALSTAQRQLDFLRALKKQRSEHDNQRPLISVGTYARLVYGDTTRVRQLFDRADLLFMNENEAKGLFGGLNQAQTRPGTVLFVTLAESGALVIEGDNVTHIPGQLATEIDPTGAGDTFCGATLAGLVQGASTAVAAQYAAALAAQMVQSIGPAALLKEAHSSHDNL